MKVGQDYSLTITKVRIAEVGSKVESKSSDIVIQQAKRLEVHPLVTKPSLKFEGENPALLSMIPGSGHHFIREIKLSAPETMNPLAYVISTMNFHETNILKVNKGFFVSKISSPTAVINDVVMSLSPEGVFCQFRMGESYLALEKKKGASQYRFTPISAFEHSVNSGSVASNTRPQDKAIRMASAGRESESDLWRR